MPPLTPEQKEIAEQEVDKLNREILVLFRQFKALESLPTKEEWDTFKMTMDQAIYQREGYLGKLDTH